LALARRIGVTKSVTASRQCLLSQAFLDFIISLLGRSIVNW